MSNKIFIVDSFTDQPFKGNPAGVQLVDQPLQEKRMQSIATELNFSETAFVCPDENSTTNGNHSYRIRYFSPVMEIPLCGHATLASAKVMFDAGHESPIQFRTIEDRLLSISQVGNQIQMEFPVYELEPATAPMPMLKALGIDQVTYAGFNRETNILLLEIESHEQLVNLKPDFQALITSHDSIHGACITARGAQPFDFFSRFFWPWSGGEEDPVTGATHTFMAKYWSDKLKKKSLKSFQASPRSGQMDVEITANNTLLIRGQAVIVAEGLLRI